MTGQSRIWEYYIGDGSDVRDFDEIVFSGHKRDNCKFKFFYNNGKN